MSRLTMQPATERDWVRLTLTPNPKFLEFLKYGIKPPTQRRYDSEVRAWYVHWRQLRSVAQMARRHFVEVDWRMLPDAWQLFLAGADVPVTDEPATVNPFAVLYVTDDAPTEVIRAAYHALVTLHHPDRGGNVSKMQEINQAYEAIQAKRRT